MIKDWNEIDELDLQKIVEKVSTTLPTSPPPTRTTNSSFTLSVSFCNNGITKKQNRVNV